MSEAPRCDRGGSGVGTANVQSTTGRGAGVDTLAAGATSLRRIVVDMIGAGGNGPRGVAALGRSTEGNCAGKPTVGCSFTAVEQSETSDGIDVVASDMSVPSDEMLSSCARYRFSCARFPYTSRSCSWQTRAPHACRAACVRVLESQRVLSEPWRSAASTMRQATGLRCAEPCQSTGVSPSATQSKPRRACGYATPAAPDSLPVPELSIQVIASSSAASSVSSRPAS
jgi:hypothetical protein